MECISVIMSTYNEEEKDLNRAIQSILKQTYKDIEFIIICDNPQNKQMYHFLKKVAKEHKNVFVYINEQNIGLTASLNKALAYAKGTYIARMDADDYSYPERLEQQLQHLKEYDLDLLGCYVECVDDTGKTIYYMNSMPITSDDIKKKIKFNNPVAHPTWFAKREVFEKNEGYRNVPYAEDFDFLLRAMEQGAKVGNLNKILFKYTIRESSISKSNGLKQFLISKALIQAYKKNEVSRTTIESITTSINGISAKSEKRFANSSNDFAVALKKMNEKNVMFIVYMMRACLQSRYFTSKIIGYGRAFL